MWTSVVTILIMIGGRTSQDSEDIQQDETTRGRGYVFTRRHRNPMVTSDKEKLYYNPNYGYEPYWANGQWMIKPDPLGPNETVTSPPLVCGEECDPSYHGIGKLCASQARIYWLSSCYWKECYGEKFSDFTYYYQTFLSYCKFLDANCKLRPNQWWGILYMGECVKDNDKIFLPIVNNTIIHYRMTDYLAALSSRLASVSFVTL